MTDTKPAGTMSQELRVLREEIERTTGKTPEQLYEEREQRVRDAINLHEPDQVPMWVIPDASRHTGVQRSAAYYDPVAWNKAVRDTILYYEPDLALGGFGSSGRSWELLDVKNRLWPGGPLPHDYEYQYVEGEYMKEDEYDLFLNDPADFVVRCYLPRVYGILGPLAQLPPLGNMFNSFEGILGLFASPDFERLARALHTAALEQQQYRDTAGNLTEELALLGFPPFSTFGGVGGGGAPFDTLSSFLRGMQGTMVDMFRRPDKLLQACDLILQQRIDAAVPANTSADGAPTRIGLPLWRGDLCFMSDKQFDRFYWPGLKKALQASIDLGYCPIPFFEAQFGHRLERLLELPKGKIVALIDHTDVKLAKEILGGHTCIIATAPASLKYRSLREAGEYYKDLIRECGPGGGLMLNLTFPDDAGREDVKAMIDSLREYGRY